MKSSYSQNNFLSYLLILGSFFVILFFTKNIYTDLQLQLDEKEQKQYELQKKDLELNRLNDLKKTLSEEGSETLGEIEGFSTQFSDREVLEHIYSYANGVNSGDDKIIIRDISLDAGEKSDIGFKKAQIDVSAIFSSESTLFGFLNFLTSSQGKYKFYIDQLSYPMGQKSGNLQVNVPLTLYYK